MLTKTIKAKYRHGVLELLEKVDIPEGLDVRIHLETPETFSEDEKIKRFHAAAGGWKDLLDCEQFLKNVYESRNIHTRPDVAL